MHGYTHHLHRVKKHVERSKKHLHRRFPEAVSKLQSLNLDLKDIRRHSANMLSAAAIAGGVLAASPAMQSATQPTYQEMPLSKEQIESIIKGELKELLPSTVGPLNPNQEEQITALLRRTLGIQAVAKLDGNRLNTAYGRIGGEQHLPRYPGDSIAHHDELQVKGITKNRGAFGYFAPSQSDLSEEDIMREKYYVAVQTLYLPNWNTDHRWLKDWYKFRKVLVVNPTNGRSIVAVVGDAGPAAWTGKHFGGSPEVMAYLQPWTDKNNGKVLLFFVDDQENKVALGPMETKMPTYLASKD